MASRLFFGDSTLSSERGVQQGDPLGPLFFSLVLHRCVARVRQRCPQEVLGGIDFVVFFLDDGLMAGTAEALAWLVQELEVELAAAGLQLDPGKCTVTPSAGASSDPLPGGLANWKVNLSGDLKVLGAAAAAGEICEGLVAKRARAASVILDLVPDLGDSQASLLLLRACAGYSRLAYNARTMPVDLQSGALHRFDDEVRNACSRMLNRPIPEQS